MCVLFVVTKNRFRVANVLHFSVFDYVYGARVKWTSSCVRCAHCTHNYRKTIRFSIFVQVQIDKRNIQKGNNFMTSCAKKHLPLYKNEMSELISQWWLRNKINTRFWEVDFLLAYRDEYHIIFAIWCEQKTKGNRNGNTICTT